MTKYCLILEMLGYNACCFCFFSTDIGVFFCGPAGLSHTLHMMSNEYSDESKGVKFFYNKENF